MPAIRQLPPRPSLEYARKEAKALLRRLRAGDPEALARSRARHPQIDRTDPARIRLADAQLVFAREHGFASWPRLARYLGDVERQQHGHQQLHGDRAGYESRARHLLADHGARGAWAGRSLAAYVPRFYEMPLDEIYASTVTEEEARMAVARGLGAPSWEVLLERLEAIDRTKPGEWEVDPMRLAREAMRAGDVSALERVVSEHPALLQPSGNDISAGHTLMMSALWLEQRQGADGMRPIMEWLATRGFDRERELGFRLRGHPHMKPEEVRDLLAMGADPGWVAPNGIPVLEHALLRYWNGEAVDVLAARTAPRRALWIAAGLGDVDGVRGFLDREGRPTAAARRLRPDFVGAGRGMFGPQLPDADDEEILAEAMLVALLNGRTPVLDYLASRGAPLNSVVYGAPLVTLAVGNGMADAVECLVRRGADLDLRGWVTSHTAREAARERFEQEPERAENRRIAELCGWDPDALLAERNARPAPAPEMTPGLRKAIAFASIDAARLGQPDVRPENLLLAQLWGELAPYVITDTGALSRFYAEFAERLAPPAEEEEDRAELPMRDDARAVLDAAIALAVERRRGELSGLHVLVALASRDDGGVGELLARYGVTLPALRESLAQWL